MEDKVINVDLDFVDQIKSIYNQGVEHCIKTIELGMEQNIPLDEILERLKSLKK